MDFLDNVSRLIDRMSDPERWIAGTFIIALFLLVRQLRWVAAGIIVILAIAWFRRH